jgi:hypothetical protein
MECIELVRIANQKGDRAPLGIGSSLLQKHLYLAKVHAGEGRRITTPCKRKFEAQLFRVEVYGGRNIADNQNGVELLTFDYGRGRGRHGFSSFVFRPK